MMSRLRALALAVSLASAFSGAFVLPALADSRTRDDWRARMVEPADPRPVGPPEWTGRERPAGWNGSSRDDSARDWGRDDDQSHGGRMRGYGDLLSPWQMRRILRDQGFVRVDITHQRGALAGATAIDWRGRPVRLRIDLTSGQVLRVVRFDAGWGAGPGWSGEAGWGRPW